MTVAKVENPLLNANDDNAKIRKGRTVAQKNESSRVINDVKERALNKTQTALNFQNPSKTSMLNQAIRKRNHVLRK